jgi:hypothetical protein
VWCRVAFSFYPTKKDEPNNFFTKTMAKAPSTKPYRAVAVAIGEDGDLSDDHRPGYSEESGQVDDDDDSDDDDGGGVAIIATRPKYRCRRLVVSACLLAALAFGCRIAYIKFFGEGSSSGVAVADKAGWFDDDASAEKYELEINDDESLEGDDFLVDLLEGENVNDDGEEIYEGYLDDEIKNGEVGGEVDSDMDYDYQGEEMNYENGGDYLSRISNIEYCQELPSEIIAPEEELPDYFVPLTPVERKELKDKLRSTLRATKSALLISANSDSVGSSNPSPQRTLVLDSNVPKQFMHMHHMKTGEEAYVYIEWLLTCCIYRFIAYSMACACHIT